MTNILSFSTFSNCFTWKQLKMTHNGEFCQKSGLDWLKMANFGHFACFPIFFPKMMLRLTQIDQFHLIYNFSIFCHQSVSFLEKCQKFSFLGGGGTSANILNFQLFKIVSHQNGSKLPIMVNFAQESGLDWLKMANFGNFACFPIFSSKMRLRLTWNGQFHLIHNFSHLLPPKCLIFGEISKIFISGRGVRSISKF